MLHFSNDHKNCARSYLITTGVKMRQKFSIDEVLGVVDDQVHDSLGNEITRGFRHDLHVRIHEIPNRLHLPLQLRVHGRLGFIASLQNS